MNPPLAIKRNRLVLHPTDFAKIKACRRCGTYGLVASLATAGPPPGSDLTVRFRVTIHKKTCPQCGLIHRDETDALAYGDAFYRARMKEACR